MNTQQGKSSEEGKDHLINVTDHYRFLAKKYDYVYKEIHEGIIPVLMKTLDLKPGHVVADIGSVTGFIAAKLFELSGLSNPIWCVDPCAEMQEVARQRKGLYHVQKTAEEFFLDPHISDCFDRVISVMSTHHFVNPDDVYKGIFHSLRPGGIFVQTYGTKCGYPLFKSAEKLVSELSRVAGREAQVSFLRAINLDASVSYEESEEFSFRAGVTKSKLYEMFRCRYMSMLAHFSDEQVEEGIKELENEVFKDVKDDELIDYDHSFVAFKVQKKSCQ